MKASLQIVWDSLRLLVRHPILLLPMAMFWALWATIVVLWNNHYVYEITGQMSQLTAVFILICIGSYALCVAALTILEMVEQIETDKPVRLVPAAVRALTVNTVRAAPIMLGFAILWFILNMIANILSSKHVRRGLTLRGARKRLTEDGSTFFHYGHKVLRALVFSFLPAIAWEDHWAPGAVVRGLAVIRSNIWRYLGGLVTIEIVGLVVWLPVGFLIEWLDGRHIEIPPWGDLLIILWLGVIASLTLFLEVIFIAQLYLWFMRWEKAKADALKRGAPPPSLEDTPRPSVLDNIPDLA